MNIFKWFTAGPAGAAKVLDAGIKGLDKLVLTPEEKLDYMKTLGGQWLEVQNVMLHETSVQSITRRFLAFFIILPYVLMTCSAVAVWPWRADYSKFIFDVLGGDFGWMALGVMAFYFGTYMLQRVLPGAGSAGGGKTGA